MPKATSSSDDELPEICQSCLGDKENIRMTRDVKGEPCKLCNRPFTVYRWQPASGARRNATKICRTCSRRKAACQCCMLDLNYGLPLALRDAVLQISTDTGKDVVVQKYIAESKPSLDTSQQVRDRTQALMRSLAQKLGSPGVSGSAAEDAEVVADKDPKRAAQQILKQLPLQGSIRANPHGYSGLFIMGLEPDLDVGHLRSKLNALGSLNELAASKPARCAFATFTDTQQVEKAASQLALTNGLLTVDGNRLRLVWGPPPLALGSSKTQQIIGLVIRRYLKTGKLPGNSSSEDSGSASSNYRATQSSFDD